MAYPPISTLPTPPSRQDPANFADNADAFLGALPDFQSETNAAGTYIDGIGTQVDADKTAAAASATAASTSATNAANSATAAANSAASAGGVLWVSGTSYSVGDVVYSPIDFQNYRCIQATSGTTDPSLDVTNWLVLNGLSGLTATVDELNILDGLTATTAELNYNDIANLGTSEASKVVTADANGDVTLAAELKATSYNESYVALSGATPTIDCEAGNVFALNPSTANTSFTISNPPLTGTAFGFTLIITAGGTHTFTYPASVVWPGGTAPDAPASGETNALVFFTFNGGTTWYGLQAGAALA